MYFMAMPKCNVISECKDNDSLQKYLALIANDSEFDSLLANSSCLPKKCQKLSWKFHEKRHIADLTTSNWKKVFEGYEGHTIISFRLQNRKVMLWLMKKLSHQIWPFVDIQTMFLILQLKIDEAVVLYDFKSLVADFGGYLGLLFGASILGIYDGFIEFLSACCTSGGPFSSIFHQSAL